MARNIDINSKLVAIYKKKRNQHKNHYHDFPNTVKMYYFFIDYFPQGISINYQKLIRIMHKGEVAVLCATYTEIRNNKQALAIIAKGVKINIDLRNPFFEF